MSVSVTLWLVGIALAFANGSNDQPKGVATFVGSGRASFGMALSWATASTALGSVAALYLARELLAVFSGQGVVPSAVAGNPAFAASVGAAAGTTVLLASRAGLPVSTTHALLGALLGAGFVRSGTAVDLVAAARIFGIPLLVGPALAAGTGYLGVALLRPISRRLGVPADPCVCVEAVGLPPSTLLQETVAGPRLSALPSLRVGTREDRGADRGRASRAVVGLPLMDALHFLSSGAVSFARGLNDAPKMAAILLAGSGLGPSGALLAVAAAMALGGLLASRPVAGTMSRRITELEAGPGLAANLVTSAVVVGSSLAGAPVSTTHVACGSLFGVGTATGRARPRVIAAIAWAWLATLPAAALLGVLVGALALGPS